MSINEFDKKLMLKFLDRNYPISRLKYNGRFKRGIILDSGEAFLVSTTQHNVQLKRNLIDILMKVFGCDEATSRVVLSNFLRLA